VNAADWLKFGGIYLGSKYDLKVNDKLTITPMVSWKKEEPWSYSGNVSENYNTYYVNDAYRTLGSVTGLYKPTEKIGVTFGVEAGHDKSVKRKDEYLYASNNKSSVSYTNLATFAEVIFQHKIANFVVGARYDNHSQFGDAFVPRLAITKVVGRFHTKALLSRAFKAPSINNLEGNLNIKPEFTTVAEVELGYLITDHMSISGNVFYNKIDDPILYFYNVSDDTYGYNNYESASTVGIELDSKIKYSWGYINSSYSFYKNNNTVVEPYEIEGEENLLRGFPAHKIAVTSGVNINDKFVVAPSFIYNSKKIGYFYQGEYWDDYSAYTFDPTFILNIVVHYNVVENAKLSVGVNDVLGQNLMFANPYDTGYMGVPYMGREITAKLNFKF
jgi:outer membrane receptor for ferrienterochelin and colicin